MFQLKLKEANKNEPVSQRVGESAKDKDLIDLQQNPICFWIDSSGGPIHLCNHSIQGANPKYYLYGSLNGVNLHECENGAITFANENCFDFLEEKINEEKQNKNGIFVGYIAYDLFRGEIKNDYPDFFFAYFENVIASEDCFTNTDTPTGRLSSLAHNDVLHSNMTDHEYLEKVTQIKEEIKAGNVYQANLTREYFIQNTNSLDETDLYLKLREVSPNPYGCFFKTPFLSILSSSPEEFLYLELKDSGRYIRTRPIKGTMPKDIFEIDPKNQAENIMIVDLERNDLGRICEYGTIKTEKLLEIESYKHLNHVVSTAEGKLKKEVK